MVGRLIDNMEIIGYHGTNKDNIESIRKANFKISAGDEEWLGHGVYFFVDGIACPIESSKGWAIAQSWNNTNKSNNYPEYCVLSAKITSEHILDLRVQEDLIKYNSYRDHVVNKCGDYFRKNSYKKHDNLINNMIAGQLGLEVIISNLFIKFRAFRIAQLISRMPNVSVLCAKNADCINAETIKIICEGEVNEY